METIIIKTLAAIVVIQCIIITILLVKVSKGRKAYAIAYNDVIRRIRKEAKRQQNIKNKKL